MTGRRYRIGVDFKKLGRHWDGEGINGRMRDIKKRDCPFFSEPYCFGLVKSEKGSQQQKGNRETKRAWSVLLQKLESGRILASNTGRCRRASATFWR